MKNLVFALAAIVLGLFLLSPAAFAGEPHHKPYTGSRAFERMKGAVGTWEGTQSMQPDKGPVRVDYRLTANGSAVVETLFPNTAEEMVSVYNDHNGRLSMTHYCALGNQPRMQLVRANNRTIEMDFMAAGSDIDPTRDAHIHSLSIEWMDKDHMIQRWRFFENGKQAGVNVINLKRVN